jgi:hypothetical protein
VIVNPISVAMALAASAVAQTSGKPCLTSGEAQAIVMVSLPDSVVVLQSRCRPNLPATSPLVQSGAVVAARWRVEAETAVDDATRAIDKVSRLPLSSIIGADASRKSVQQLISREISTRLALGNCAAASEIVDGLSPLPARNVARIILGLVDTQPDKAALPFQICKQAA